MADHHPEGADIPAASAAVDPAAGAATTFTGHQPGSYRVTATQPGSETSPPAAAISVVEPTPAAAGMPKLPFIGEGYGSIVGAILVPAVVVLAATRAIDADVIGVLLGSITGCLFGVGVARATS
jgi:hypothetical protein